MAAVDPLLWSPGLYLSASGHAEDMKNQSTVTTVGTDDSQPTERASLYGEGTIYETNVIGANSAEFVVMQALIGDTDEGAARTKMLKATYTQVGIAQIAHSDYTSLTVIDYATDAYVVAEPYASCTTEEDDTTDLQTGAMGLVLGVASAAVMAVLF